MNTQNLPMDKHLLLQFKRGLQDQQRELSQAIEKAEKEIRDFAGRFLSTLLTSLVSPLRRNPCSQVPVKIATACIRFSTHWSGSAMAVLEFVWTVEARSA